MYARFSPAVCAVGREPSEGGASLVIAVSEGASLAVDFAVQEVNPNAAVVAAAETSAAAERVLKSFFMFNSLIFQKRVKRILRFNTL